MSKKASLLWVDLEMTGLVPGVDKIMEVAAVATGWDLEPVAEYTGIVKVSKKVIQERMVGEFWEKNKKAYQGMPSIKQILPTDKIVGRWLVSRVTL